MKDAEELNLNLLERSLEEHENARANFSRDLKFAVVLLIVFQFFVFFRFAKLSDQQFDLRPKLEQAEAHQRALGEIRTAVDSLEAALKTGTAQLTTLLGDLPQQIRNELGRLNDDLTAFRAAPFPPPRNDMAMQMVQAPNANINAARSAHRSESKFIADLTFDQAAELHDVDTASPVFRERVVQIVEHQIIQPAFENLNERAAELVTAPLAKGAADLRERNAALTVLKANRADVDGWLKNADQVVTVARGLHFSPPAEGDWWTSARTKASFAKAAQLDTAKIAEEARSALSGPDSELKSLAEKMESTIAGLKQEGARIEAELKQLREHAVSLEDLIEGYAKPLAVLALEPKDLVIFYPVFLAAIVCTFAVRQILLRRRAATLAEAYRKFGASEEILAVCFTELRDTRTDEVAGERVPWALVRRFAEWLWAIPVAFAVASFAWVLTSKSLGDEAPRLLYLLSALGLVVVCVLLFRATRERPASV